MDCVPTIVDGGEAGCQAIGIRVVAQFELSNVVIPEEAEFFVARRAPDEGSMHFLAIAAPNLPAFAHILCLDS